MRASAIALYVTVAAILLVEIAAVVVSLFTGSETTRAGAGFVMMIALGLAAAARLTLALRRKDTR